MPFPPFFSRKQLENIDRQNKKKHKKKEDKGAGSGDIQ